MTILTSQLIIGVIMVLLAFISYKANKVKLSTSMITKLALLITLSVLLGSIFKISLPLFGPETFEIKFDTLPLMFIGILFGPWWGLLSGFIIDMIQLMLSPTSFPYLGFTLSLMLTGMITGFMFQSKNNIDEKYKNFNQWLLILSLFLAIFFIVITNQIQIRNEMIVFTHGIKWGLTAIIFFMFFVLYMQSKLYSDNSFNQRWIRCVVLCELLVQVFLTALWLNVLFNLGFIVTIPIRLIEAPIMISAYGVMGSMIYRVIYRYK